MIKTINSTQECPKNKCIQPTSPYCKICANNKGNNAYLEDKTVIYEVKCNYEK